MPRNLEKIIAGVALLVLLALGGWFMLQRSDVGAIEARNVRVSLASDSYTSTPVSVPTSEARVWNDPAANAAEPAWVFDVFTPPVIYYNRLTKEFTVTPPDYSTPPAVEPEPEPELPPFGVELLAVEIDSFRLQLVGYAGGEGDYLGMFEKVSTGETVLGRAGRSFPDLGLTVQTLAVARETVEVPDSMPLTQVVARAAVLDGRTGEVVQLSSLERRVQGTPSARLRIVASAEERTEKTGASFPGGSYTFRIDAIEVSPAAVRVTRTETATGEVVTETLVVGGPAPAAVPASPPGDAEATPAENAPAQPTSNDPFGFFGD